MSLTISLEHAAEILGTTPPKLRGEIKKKKVAAIRIGGDTRVSVFVLAKLLSTSPLTLLDYLEDESFGRMLEEADKEKGLGLDEAQRRYAELAKAA